MELVDRSVDEIERSTGFVLKEVLLNVNGHPRDKLIFLEKDTHVYNVDGDRSYTSVTTFVNAQFKQFNGDNVIDKMMKGKKWKEGHEYWGMSKDEIKKKWSENGRQASENGTKMHFMCECFMNNPGMKYPYTQGQLVDEYLNSAEDLDAYGVEWKYFINFVQANRQLIPYRTEQCVFHEGFKIAGSIDMIYDNGDGTHSIYDWKRTKDAIVDENLFKKFASAWILDFLPDNKFWHYTLQLNIYKVIVEEKYGMKITKLCLVRMHPNADDFQVVPLPDVSEGVKMVLEYLTKEKAEKKK